MTHVSLRFIPTILVAAAALVMAFARPVGATPFPGPDAFGYTGTNIPPTLLDISSTGTPVPLGDEQVSGPLRIGFTFTFYGINYTLFQISSNGLIHLGTAETDDGCCDGDPIPAPNPPQNLVAGWWEDLDPSFWGQCPLPNAGSDPEPTVSRGVLQRPAFWFV